MANILSLKEVAYYFYMTMDIKKNHAILVHYSKDKAYRFKECGKDLYYLNVYNSEIITPTTEMGGTDNYLLPIMNANMEYFTRAYIEVLYRSRDLQHLLVWPSNQQLINALSKNFIINFPVMLYDVRRSHAIYGRATDILKGGNGEEEAQTC